MMLAADDADEILRSLSIQGTLAQPSVAQQVSNTTKLKQPIADVVDVVTAVHAKSMKSISAANTNQKQFFGIKIVLFKDKST